MPTVCQSPETRTQNENCSGEAGKAAQKIREATIPNRETLPNRETMDVLKTIGIFGVLPEADLERLSQLGTFINVARGETLVHEGEDASTLYFVIEGRFAVLANGGQVRAGLIGRGAPVGEIAFFRGGRRTADVVALRTSLVLGFERAQFAALMQSVPHLAQTMLHALSNRLADATPRMVERTLHHIPGSIAIAPAGGRAVNPDFIEALAHQLSTFGKVSLMDSASLRARFGEWQTASANDVTNFVEIAETAGGFCLFDCSGLPDGLARQLLGACDEFIFIGDFDGPEHLNPLEIFAHLECAGAQSRLVLCHLHAAPVYPGTARWLRGRHPFMHHHVADDDAASMARLARFIAGAATGFIASGGGAACAAQIGVYQAFRDIGVKFDYLCGTSGGAAMAAAFAHDLAPEDIHTRLHDMFITRRALSRYTIPRYALLDHRPFDTALRAHYGESCIEDLAQPFFAISTNLSTGGEYLHRSGPLWQAVRASSAIPGLLPPYYTAEGDMLVDGCLVDNLPVRRMRNLKAGPNVAVSLRLPGRRYFDVPYDELPGGWRVASTYVSALIGRTQANARSKVPGIAEVLTLSLTLSRDMEFPADSAPGMDLLFLPPVPENMGIMQWSRHGELAAAAHSYAAKHIASLRKQGHAALEAILATATKSI